MSVYGKAKGAKPTSGGQYYPPDFEGVVRVDAIKEIEVRNKKNGAFIVETTAIISNLEKVPPGAKRSWYVDLDQDPAPNNLAHWDIVLTKAMTGKDITPDDVEEEDFEDMLSEEQPATGTLLGLRTYLNKKGTFTKHEFSALTEKGLAEAKAAEKALAKSKPKAAPVEDDDDDAEDEPEEKPARRAGGLRK